MIRRTCDMHVENRSCQDSDKLRELSAKHALLRSYQHERTQKTPPCAISRRPLTRRPDWTIIAEASSIFFVGEQLSWRTWQLMIGVTECAFVNQSVLFVNWGTISRRTMVRAQCLLLLWAQSLLYVRFLEAKKYACGRTIILGGEDRRKEVQKRSMPVMWQAPRYAHKK